MQIHFWEYMQPGYDAIGEAYALTTICFRGSCEAFYAEAPWKHIFTLTFERLKSLLIAGFISCTGTNFLIRANAFGMVSYCQMYLTSANCHQMSLYVEMV